MADTEQTPLVRPSTHVPESSTLSPLVPLERSSTITPKTASVGYPLVAKIQHVDLRVTAISSQTRAVGRTTPAVEVSESTLAHATVVPTTTESQDPVKTQYHQAKDVSLKVCAAVKAMGCTASTISAPHTTDVLIKYKAPSRHAHQALTSMECLAQQTSHPTANILTVSTK